MCSRVRRGLLQRASCMSAELGGVYFLSSFSRILVVPRANHLFQHVFPLFPTATRKCVCVCVWFKFVGFLPKFWLLRLAVRPADGRGGAPGKLSSGCLLFPARVVLFHFSLDACSVVARVFVRIVIFGLAVHIHVFFRAGPACAGSATRSPLCSWLQCEPRAAAEG